MIGSTDGSQARPGLTDPRAFPTPTPQFAMLDKDGNGILTYDELYESLLSMPGLQSIPRCVCGVCLVSSDGLAN